ncbi:hypothetical protein PN36_12120 [Candidatus Thiomargarita nelsonii]|uniref:Uncharacterized protein n=1 Tax=Candidatus Thiomargarita nelsonii TaxID=1003181 RepID=A0A4E0QQZ8_9GAMM|nr:hypothetical protein PN36_12120 [Candidatus Thiomargarita nelsonii]
MLEENIWRLRHTIVLKKLGKRKNGRLWLEFPNLKDSKCFFYPPKPRVRCIGRDLYIKLKCVRRKGSHWEIDIEGVNGQKVILIFDENYELIEIFGDAIKNGRQKVIQSKKPMEKLKEKLKEFVN